MEKKHEKDFLSPVSSKTLQSWISGVAKIGSTKAPVLIVSTVVFEVFRQHYQQWEFV